MTNNRSERQDLRPAFGKPIQAVAFGLLVVAALLQPFFPNPPWLDRASHYIKFCRLPGQCAYGLYTSHYTLQESDDIDLLFFGHSALGRGIDVEVLTAEFEKRFGRKPVIRIIAHPGDTGEYDYMALLDVLSRRRVKLAFFHLHQRSTNTFDPRRWTRYLWNISLHEPVLRELTIRDRSAVYWINVQQGLRDLLSFLKSPTRTRHFEPCFIVHAGACPEGRARDRRTDPIPAPPELSLDRLIHMRGYDSWILLQERKLTQFHALINDAIIDLCEANGVQYAYFQMPSDIERSPMNRLIVPHLWPARHGKDAFVVGGILRDLFPGFTRMDIANRFFRDYPAIHLHPESASYVTKLLTPGFLEVYDLLVENNQNHD